MSKLSAFADEVTDDFLGQLKFLTDEQIHFIELRFINKKNVTELTGNESKEAKKMLDGHGLKVSAIGSPIGKVALDEPFADHLDKFKRTVELALFFETPLIRIFSYYAPAGETITDCRTEVIDRMHAKLEVISNYDVILVHENEADIYGQTAGRCVDLVETINSPKLRLAYDPANFVHSDKITNSIETCWPLMKPYVAHIHIKDWKLNALAGSVPGTGHTQIKQLLGELVSINYQGFMTIEPHLQEGGQFSGTTGPQLFSKAVAAVRKLAEEAGLDCE